MADLLTQFGISSSLLAAINEVKASGTSIAGTDAQIKRAKANLDAAELSAKQEKEREKIQKKKESLKTEETEQVDEADNLALRGSHTANPQSIPNYMRSTEKGKKSLADKNKPVLKDLIKRQLGNHPKPNLPEEVEAIQELSKATLKSYTDKSVQDVGDNMAKSDKHSQLALAARKKGLTVLDRVNTKAADKAKNKVDKRVSGMIKATGKMKTEEETSVDEELKGNQHKLDKNKNGKLDAEDFKKVRKEPAKKSVAEGIMDKIKAVKRGMEARAKASDHFDKATEPSNPDKSKDLKRAVKYHNLVNKEETEHIDEAPKYDNKYTVYHKDYSSAVQHAAVHAGKQGYEIDHDDWDRVVAMGPKKPSSGKTNMLSVSLKKDGKESKKKLHMQVYNMDNKGYELNTYVEEVEQSVAEGVEILDELNDAERLKKGKSSSDEVRRKYYDKAVTAMIGNSNKEKDKAILRYFKVKQITDPDPKTGQIDELNKDTVYSYAKKSEKDQDSQEKKMYAAVKAKDPKTANDANRKFQNRMAGSERAEKRLNKEESDDYDEFKSGGKPLEKKFNKAFKAMGIKSDVKIKTVGNVSVNEAMKPTKKFKDMKKKNTAGTKSEEGASKKGEPLSGKKEAIEVNPDLHKNQK
jgi:hypothetical protein